MQVVEAQLEWLVWDCMADRFSDIHRSAMSRWMDENGQPRPVVVDNATCCVVAGLSAVEAARDLCWDDIEVVLLDDSRECEELVGWWEKWDAPFATPAFHEAALDRAIAAIPF